MNVVRRSALALHAMDAVDRDWMLSRLSAAECAQVRPQLAELRMLGIPASATLAGEMVWGRSDEPAIALPPTARQLVARAPALAVFALLANEPARMIGLVLASGDWPWRDEFFRMLTPRVQRQVSKASAPSLLPTPALAQALVAAVAEQIVPLVERPSMRRSRLRRCGLWLTACWARLISGARR
jgi:hypothetical protein